MNIVHPPGDVSRMRTPIREGFERSLLNLRGPQLLAELWWDLGDAVIRRRSVSAF
jgi:hypothetical protein